MPTYVERVMRSTTGFSLTETQSEIIDAVLGGVSSAEHSVIEGPAGTGKSTLMSALILEAVHRGYRVAIAAPTHKAAKVLARMLNKLEAATETTLPEPVTIHSLLKLIPMPARPGQTEKLRQKGKPDLRAFDLLIVDECSMIGKDLHGYIVEAAEEADIALLFTGDSCQLQPVNEFRKSPCFTTGTRYVLTEVLRHDGAILKLATRARKLPRPQVLADSDGATEVRTYSNRGELKEAWLEHLAELDATEGDPESYPVMLCWTNANRRQFNREARQHLYGSEVPDFMEDDRLVTLSAYMDGDMVLIPNNADVTVTKAKYLQRYSPVPGYSYSAWELVVDNTYTVHVLADESILAHKRDVKALGGEISGGLKKAEARVKELLDRGVVGGSPELGEAKRERDAIHRRWSEEYFSLKDHFIDVDFGYACTIHKSQGSTYDHVYVWNDYEPSSERKELLYVAVTRAAKTLNHVHVGLQRQAA
jgi:exodeoxyribonuclease-5